VTALHALSFFYFLSALSAYSLYSIPIPWLGQVGTIVLAGVIVARRDLRRFPGLNIYAFFCFWAFLVTLVNMVVSNTDLLLPVHSTTSYFNYIALRFVNLIAFAGALIVVHHVARLEGQKRIIQMVANIGAGFALFALYIYLAQIGGLWEPWRNRMGTGGGAQSIVFSYAFHRAMGTFREPSHLAEWLLLPLFCGLQPAKWNWLKSILILAVILLTGSLTGVLAMVFGFAVAFLFALSRGKISASFWQIAKFAVFVLAAAGLYSAFVATKVGYSGLSSVLWDRVAPLFDRGIAASDRGYIYEYLNHQNLSLFGEGVGNANIRLSNVTHLAAVESFLSIYINTVFSLGVIGLFVLLAFLAAPLAVVYKSAQRVNHWILGAYFAWLLDFTAHSEELCFSFAIVYALISLPGFEDLDNPA
jgi:hypothetical protein